MVNYTDLNTSYRSTPNDTASVVYDLEDIKQSIMRLFTTGIGEVPFNRNYGTTLKSLLFENNVDPNDITMFIYMDITNWEPRVDLNPADIIIEKQDPNTFKISCAFRVPGLNNLASSVHTVLTR